MNPKELFIKWKQGMMNITPVQQTKAQITGTIGTIVGTIFAGAMMVMKGRWYFIIVFIFVIFLQIISLIGLKQKYKNLVQTMDMLKEQTESSGFSELDINEEAIKNEQRKIKKILE